MKRALIGDGGHAQEVKSHIGDNTMVCFVSDELWVENDNYVLPLSKFDPNVYEVIIAVGDSKDRLDISYKLPKNTKYFTFIHPSSIILSPLDIGKGSFIGANCVLTHNIKIGKHAILNRSVNIGHDTIIGDFFSAMPGSTISGNVTIYDCVYLGTHSSIKEKISIHSFTTIGLNSGVVKSITTPGTYIGTPSQKIK
jgi:sugar O-acyltransferase (sialic acid O-acetyltransferase NeuD family)